jgi:serine/threonine-protein kinase
MRSAGHALDSLIKRTGALKTLLNDRYELRQEIGRGGMATVYLAEDSKQGRQVAVKILDRDVTAKIEMERFTREIHVVARLQHPHILPLYDSGDVNGVLFFVMPYIEGQSLRGLLVREKTLDIWEISRIARQIGEALDYAHTRGVVHRDIKPENILISAGHALLADFGIARIADNDVFATLTATGAAVGTPAYMSPEQANGEAHINNRSDLYSLGCVCFEAFTGNPPFQGQTAMAVISQHIVRAPPRVTSPRQALPDSVADAVSRMLSKDPAERPATAGDFATVLEEAAYQLRKPSIGDERLQAAERDRQTRKAVFVLDFTNISGATEIDWLAGGIAETVSVDLKKIAGIEVVASDGAARQRLGAIRLSSRLDADTARDLGRSVGARWVVWGGFQKAGQRIRLTPHFSDTETGEIISADKLDGDMEDIFALQDEIVTNLANVLRIKLTADEIERIGRPETSKVSAYELCAKGRQAFQLFGNESIKTASEYFRRAVEIDPNYALAWSGLGGLLLPRYIASGSQQDLDEGVQALQRAMSLDPTMGEPYMFLAYVYARQHRYDDSIAAARTGVDHDPGSFRSWYMLGFSYSVRALETGRLSDLPNVIPPLLRAGAINPSFNASWMIAGATYALRGEYAHAVAMLDKAVAVEKAVTGFVFIGSYVHRAAVHIHRDELEAAQALLDRAINAYPTLDHVYADMATAYALFMRGILEEHRGNFAAAQSHFLASCSLAESRDHRLAIGAAWTKSKLGLSRAAFRRGDCKSSDEALDEAVRMQTERHRFVWGCIWGATDAETWYEVAATHALRGRQGESLSALGKAADFGWSDLNQLKHDPNFGDIREREDFRELCADALRRVILPPPVGNGGWPPDLIAGQAQ